MDKDTQDEKAVEWEWKDFAGFRFVQLEW